MSNKNLKMNVTLKKNGWDFPRLDLNWLRVVLHASRLSQTIHHLQLSKDMVTIL